jgi:hypothetical protein
MRKILAPAEREGRPFRTNGGQYQIIVEYRGAEAKLQIQVPESDPARWIDTNENWTEDGARAMWLSSGAVCRMTNA